MSSALAALGDYVYGYYRHDEEQPFYVGKGSAGRVLDHWKAAAAGRGHHAQHAVIRQCLAGDQSPVIRILAYRFEKTKGTEVYS